jgi:hypothetical protein
MSAPSEVTAHARSPGAGLREHGLVGLSVERGDAVSAVEFEHLGHGCQVDPAGVHKAMDPSFRDGFPLMYEGWHALAREAVLRPGDHRASVQPDGRVVHTLGIKQGMLDPVDLDAMVAALKVAVDEAPVSAIVFHRLGTRCQGRLPWSSVAPAVESVAASTATEIVVFTDEWDDLVDELLVGQHIRAVVSVTYPWPAFLDLGGPFSGFIDVLGLSEETPLELNQSLDVEVLMLDDDLKQVRARPVDPQLRRKPSRPAAADDP